MPTFQPAGWMMLNRMRTTTVKAACPAANEMTRGAYAAISTATGSTIHSTVVSPCTGIRIAAPTTMPTAVPASAVSTVQPVPSALERSTDRVPRTTQKECCRPDVCAMNTAIARPAAPRMLLRNQTDRTPEWVTPKSSAARSSERSQPSGAASAPWLTAARIPAGRQAAGALAASA